MSSLFGSETALCRDDLGCLLLCRLESEASDWEAIREASAYDIEVFRLRARICEHPELEPRDLKATRLLPAGWTKARDLSGRWSMLLPQ